MDKKLGKLWRTCLVPARSDRWGVKVGGLVWGTLLGVLALGEVKGVGT